MGCNSSSIVPVGENGKTVGKTGIKVQVNPSTPESIKINFASKESNGCFPRRTSSPPAKNSAEGTKNVFNSSNGNTKSTGFQPPKPPPPPPPPLAFDVPINGENVIKKLPPKRFRRFPSQQVENSRGLTREELNGKLQDAEIRRRLILSQRIQSAQQKIVQNKKLTHSDALSRKSEESLDEKNKLYIEEFKNG